METCERAKAKGLVKWFNLRNGYGFIVDDETGKDVLVHSKVLRQSGYAPVIADGSIVECEVEDSGNGLRAIVVTSVNNVGIQRIRAGGLCENLRSRGVDIDTDQMLQSLRACGYRLDAH